MAEDYSVGELARLTLSALAKVEGVVTRLEGGQFVSTVLFNLYVESQKTTNSSIDTRLQTLDKIKVSNETHNELKNRVQKLEDANTWLVRLVLTFIILGVLTAVVAFGNGGGQ